MKKIFFSLMALAVLFFAACKNSSDNSNGAVASTWTLKNQSTHTVDITPQGVAVPSDPFQIAPGASATITWHDGNDHYFSWNPVMDVDASFDDDAKVCVFTDK